MKAPFACLGLVVAFSAVAQAPGSAPGARPAPCADCGVVRSISVKERQQRRDTDAGKPSGLVATVPLGGGKVQVGSSTKLGQDTVVSERSWDVVVRMDDGKFRVVTVSQQPDLQEGARVRVEGTRLVSLGAGEASSALPALPMPKTPPPAQR